MEHLSGQTLVRKNKEEVSADEALKDAQIVLFYFSAHWCPPCRMFTPILADFYEEAMNEGLPLEVVFVSSDRSADALFDYMKEAHGDWFAIPHGHAAVGQVQSKYSIRGIPTLIVVKKDGTLVTENGRKDVESKGIQAAKEWLK